MTKREKDEAREERIEMEVVVDAYGPEERAMGWYYYLDDRLSFPFKARCARERTISPLRTGEEVLVERLAPEDECLQEIFVLIAWQDRTLGLPLAQLDVVESDEDTLEAVGDWHYWVEQGYSYG
ncbi:calcium-binding protein [Thiorhodococcus fuscus]|uniref:Calcium-binding protein n=1 Tax=Thiorhodococcus fuscus TaxID=527200 RepID=A0ABW4YD72_9GAMM